jgi:hypothetical protein
MGLGSRQRVEYWRATGVIPTTESLSAERGRCVLIRAREVFLNYAHLRGAGDSRPPAAIVATLGSADPG